MKDRDNSVAAMEAQATAGNIEAQFKLGLMYFSGLNVLQDYREASRWFLLAAKRGHPKAQFNLGVMYSNGLGVNLDYAEAATMFRKAAEKGYDKAQWNLGIIYERGLGVPQDWAEAYKWFHLAAMQKYDDANKACQRAIVNMTQEQIAEGQRRAAAFVLRR